MKEEIIEIKTPSGYLDLSEIKRPVKKPVDEKDREEILSLHQD